MHDEEMSTILHDALSVLYSFDTRGLVGQCLSNIPAGTPLV
jgi:hypothetical protein